MNQVDIIIEDVCIFISSDGELQGVIEVTIDADNQVVSVDSSGASSVCHLSTYDELSN